LIFGGQQFDTHAVEITDSKNEEKSIDFLEHNRFKNFSRESFVFNDLTFRIHKLPSNVPNRIRKKHWKSHSENLLGFFGEKTIVVIDLDNKKTVF
tara:strand:+ start:899 stop:1183 length:285 start_codon:yes stop_codon:yes gene_type:complete